MLTAILELGAWVGTLINGYLADAVGRRVCAVIAAGVFIIGVIVQACTFSADYVYGGRFITGLGVGSLSMIVPLYNAELAPPETRGALVAVQQLAITFGIMVSFWIGYGVSEGQGVALYLIILLTVATDKLHRWHRRRPKQSRLRDSDVHSDHSSSRARSRHVTLHASVSSPSHERRSRGRMLGDSC